MDVDVEGIVTVASPGAGRGSDADVEGIVVTGSDVDVGGIMSWVRFLVLLALFVVFAAENFFLVCAINVVGCV